jgi:hypothetical protein
MRLKLDSSSPQDEIPVMIAVESLKVLPSGQMEQLCPNALVVSEDDNERRTKRKLVLTIIMIIFEK